MSILTLNVELSTIAQSLARLVDIAARFEARYLSLPPPPPPPREAGPEALVTFNPELAVERERLVTVGQKLGLIGITLDDWIETQLKDWLGATG